LLDGGGVPRLAAWSSTTRRWEEEGYRVRVGVTKVDKPWGHELIWAHTDRYVGKILHIKAGESLSLQYHERKDETIHVLRGQMVFLVGDSEDDLREERLDEGTSFRIVPGTRHRMVAATDCDLLEASTPELDDVIRLEDRYGRA
jgi:mannose-6-phosphate isomerase-like protein (cupin superfamily)